jgi:hypothetical protein
VASRVQKIEELHKFFQFEYPSIEQQIRAVIEDGGELLGLSVAKVKVGRRTVQKVVLLKGMDAYNAPYQEEVGHSENPHRISEMARRTAQSLIQTTIEVLLEGAAT